VTKLTAIQKKFDRREHGGAQGIFWQIWLPSAILCGKASSRFDRSSLFRRKTSSVVV
jgi:hypothetical protein